MNEPNGTILHTAPVFVSDETRRRPEFDQLLALLALIIWIPVFVLCALAIKLESPGPVLFRQRRFGKNCREFNIIKFRTMSVLEDGLAVSQVRDDDPRVTRVGRILRRTSLDELPQLVNVLKGDMALVGPRPHAIIHDLEFAQSIEGYWFRNSVRPGMTGWAQVNGHRGQIRTREDLLNRVEADFYYLRNRSIWLDLEIMLRTMPIMLCDLKDPPRHRR
jgi:lipopolysaccharide/colanic/teichoic acid biosynthesis glycosyltransferase